MSNPFDDPEIAGRYENWYQGPGRRADKLEKRLLSELLDMLATNRTALDVGCGTGHFSRWLARKGLEVTGLDSAPAMIGQARQLNGLTYRTGDAMNLPFDDATFDLVTIVTALEFVNDPHRATSEAIRVARHGVLLGVLNRHSLLYIKRRFTGGAIWKTAHFFTPRELRALLNDAAGDRIARIHWKTTLLPLPLIGASSVPWGGFIGMSIGLQQDPSKDTSDA